eukprot:2461399-Amphidinium_carterae.1
MPRCVHKLCRQHSARCCAAHVFKVCPWKTCSNRKMDLRVQTGDTLPWMQNAKVRRSGKRSSIESWQMLDSRLCSCKDPH